MRTSIIRRAKAVYDNLPLPAGSAVGSVLLIVFDRARRAPLPGSRAVQRTAGGASIAAGIALNLWALIERRRRSTGEFQLEQPDALVTTGPYAFSRHPMYFGWWLIHLGVGVMRGTRWVVATLPVAVILEHVGGALAEERELSARFGDEYTRYAERVPRYAGWSPRRGGRAIS
ncbi:isoprenylcysteine carboxylmethyltransferase family protein [Agromyces sp. NPDC049794]|uniref:methyltransferase family protein n=1 Tax=unclassified Agromyces TaxID=2639701 RepID=UPI0033DD5803